MSDISIEKANGGYVVWVREDSEDFKSTANVFLEKEAVVKFIEETL